MTPPSIIITPRLLDNDDHEAHLAINVGQHQLHCIGRGKTPEEAVSDVEHVFEGMIEDLEQLTEVRRSAGKINWRLLRWAPP